MHQDSTENIDLAPYYAIQNELREKTIQADVLPDHIEYIAGTDVAYDDVGKHMVGAIVVLNPDSFEVIEQAFHKMEITFPYVPGLFSFREIPPLMEAYAKLRTKPDLIVCDAHGIAHPKHVGMATHLGIALDTPTIGCAKKRLVGQYNKDKLGAGRGSKEPLTLNGETLGYALRTQNGIKPVFVSTGHKVSAQTACDWVLKLAPEYRLPETTRQADHLVNGLLKDWLTM